MPAQSRAQRAAPMRRRLLSGGAALAGLALAGPAFASRALPGAAHALAGLSALPPGGTIPAPVGGALTQPRLAGEGRLRWFGLAIYDARLFVPADGLDPARYARTPFALELVYARSLLGEDIAQASLKEMTRMQFGTPAQRAGWLAAMRRLFPDVTAGDRLTGINRADGQVQFYRNDADIGRVEDRLFGEAFFGIWLDPRTQAPDLRRALLQHLSPSRPS